MAFSTAAVARWTILSSSAATASGRCRPSGLGMYTRRDGSARYAPRWTRACRSSRLRSEIALKVLLVVPTCQPVHPRCRILLEFKECLFEVVNTDVVEERGELLLLPLPCSLPYALQRL